jgi:hypothetical protein
MRLKFAAKLAISRGPRSGARRSSWPAATAAAVEATAAMGRVSTTPPTTTPATVAAAAASSQPIRRVCAARTSRSISATSRPTHTFQPTLGTVAKPASRSTPCGSR